MTGKLKIFSGNANVPLAQAICKHAGIELGEREVIRFSNENIKVKIVDSVRGHDVFIIQPSCTPVNDGIMELLIMIDAIKHASAARITAVVPYFPYVRSDKKDEPRISITARLMADLLETAGADRVMTMNLHSPQIQGFFRVPVDHLLAGRLLCDYFEECGTDNCVVVAPDAGSAKRAGAYAIRMNLPMAILDKRRSDDSETPYIHHVIGDVKGKRAIIFDDEIASGGSILEVVRALEDLGVTEIQACCVHPVLSGDAAEKLNNSALSKLVVTDTIFIPEEKKFPKLKVISVSELFAKAIMFTNQGKSISGLYNGY
ncbi:ribose-phosphate pyrophosphokinase [Chitinispirillales bacterium ANBcel5]|uniref:ribose-phosphate diphosphokinase n=1 Tax=Cellulosispirillum alkaliphilum TaxID=3039283 RepID=UPI002A53A502|nr:ribose-phosphate pyrophosphokinase [Chitinispirillales bacterium ANBcel5]